MSIRHWSIAIVVCLAAQGLAQQEEAAGTVARVGASVEQYFARAQSVLVDEEVTLQRLSPSYGFDGLPRRLAYEVRLEWDPSADPDDGTINVVRRRISASGPPLGPPDQPECLDPRAVTPEPLAFLLPNRRERFTFRLAGATRTAGREALRLDYSPVAPEPPQVEWDEACGRIELPGRIRGRLWVDAATAEVLRLDERLVGPVDIPAPKGGRPFQPQWFTVERADTSIRYGPVTFEDPGETLMLPARIESVTVIRSSGVPRLRTTRVFTNYRRFVTESRILR